MKKNLRILTATAIGIALFVALALCLQVPVFENYYLCLGYVVMAVYCFCFGTVSGTAVGALGVVLYCLITSGMRGMPGWALNAEIAKALVEKKVTPVEKKTFGSVELPALIREAAGTEAFTLELIGLCTDTAWCPTRCS